MLEESIYTSKLGIAFKKGTHKKLTEELTETLKEIAEVKVLQKK